MNVMTMEVTPQRRNKHEINTQIKEKQSQTATEAQNRCGGLWPPHLKRVAGVFGRRPLFVNAYFV